MFAPIGRYLTEIDKTLLFLCLTASCYGLLLVYSATHSSIVEGKLLSATVGTMLKALGVGFFGAFVLTFFRPETLARLAPYAGAICVALMVLTLFIGVGPENGSDDTAWLKLGSFYFQPSELAKVGFVMTFSLHLAHVQENVNALPNILLLGLHALVPFLLIAKNGDDGSAILFLFIFVVMMYAAGVKYYYFIGAILCILIGFPVAWMTGLIPAFQKERFLVIPFPDRDPRGYAYQQNQSVAAIGSGQVFGKGFLQGDYTQSHSVPESQNDFIFSVAGEEFGFLGCLVVLFLLTAIVLRLFRLSSRMGRGSFESHLCTGVAAMIVTQSVLNIGMCLRLLPVIGITLPFFSSGGSSNLCLYLGIGLVFSVYRHRAKQYPTNYRIL